MDRSIGVVEKIKILLEMIQFKLTIFAMPFAFTGAFLAAKGVPSARVFFFVVLAMVGARTCAMGFNRIVDRKFDGANPRTTARAIPAGAVKLVEAWSLVLLSGCVFFLSCWQLNTLTLMLSPLALGLTLLYSFTKRFTAFCHLVLGMALAFSPFGGWVAVQGNMDNYPYALSIGVIFWVAGFDTIYACLDADFDKEIGLYSLPAKIGKKGAFRLAGLFHVLAFICFIAAGLQAGLNFIYYVGVLIAAGALYYQHRLVKPEDLSHIHASFFSMNGIISVAIFLATWLSLMV